MAPYGRQTIQQGLFFLNYEYCVRTRLIEIMMLCADFDVLVIRPPGTFNGVSGELKPRVPELIKKDEALEKFFYNCDPTQTDPEDIADAILAPDGHFKLPHLWPPKLLQAGRPNYRCFG